MATDEQFNSRTTNGRRRPAERRWLADLLAEALALEAVRLALAAGEVLRLAHVGAVVAAYAHALVLVALRQAVPRLRHLRRPHLCGDEEQQEEDDGCGHATRERHLPNPEPNHTH